jgi:cell wall-associated NlpC family hydrolase
MRFSAKNAISSMTIVLMLCGATHLAEARQPAEGGEVYDDRSEPSGFQQQSRGYRRALSRRDGQTIINAALHPRHHERFAFDCSHFVHGMYERAGFSYEYASSIDLYQGIEEFLRVTNPQPGDLAVWRGHVGIVVDPAERSFISVLHSGPGIDYYDTRYWKRRGRPRFFRYINQTPTRNISPPIRASLNSK